MSWGRYGGAMWLRFGFGVGVVFVVSGLVLLSVEFVDVVAVDGLAVGVVVVVAD